MQYATASEDLAEDPKKKKAPLLQSRAPLSSDSEEEESDDSGGDDVLRLLKRASRTGTERATGSADAKGKKPKKSARYPLLAESRSLRDKNRADPVALALESMVSGQNQSLDNGQLSMIIQMEVLKQLRDKKGQKPAQKSDSHENSGNSSLEESSSEEERLKGAGKALRAYRKSKRRMRKNPEKHIKRYVREVEDFLGVTSDGAYMMTDFSKKLAWGKNHTLYRIHYALSHMLQTVLKGKLSQVGLQITQLLRAIYQANLDGGSWKTAWLLLDIQDPLDRPRFGGEAQQLEVGATYVKAMTDLERRSRFQGRPEEDGSSGQNQKGKSGGKGKSKKSTKEEEKPES